MADEDQTLTPEDAIPSLDDVDDEIDFSKKKKKKLVKKSLPSIEDDIAGEETSGGPALSNNQEESASLPDYKTSERDYVYSELLKRIYDRLLGDKGGSLFGAGAKKQIDPPEVLKVGTKRVAWGNFMANCKSINRKPEHVLEFVLTELGTTGSLTGDNKLIIKGRFQSKQLENVLRKYIAEYVTCRTCRSPNTSLKKENRILFKVCGDCGATSSVTAIKSGFRAQTKRKKE